MDSRKLSLMMFAGFMVLVIFALYHFASPYKTPSDLIKMESAENVQVVGKIADVRANGHETRFVLTDGKNEIDVVYQGEVQKYDTEVVVVGDWKNGVLIAKEILRKCHTEYTGG
ncbi:cytochrome c maturation protein CcmE domain-containing protein [Archaeoglobus neptunius]|uniref:cytochrome c maturation protein CcmE domain-containing protein n=1 Tax=Archaeoglobus neptunius TaxID=2798580 RepID=UPI0019251F63|nr:cytochrome c maturation protein CcmE [Archaeoglobus neptunius]